jgi:hypothetical protein
MALKTLSECTNGSSKNEKIIKLFHLEKYQVIKEKNSFPNTIFIYQRAHTHSVDVERASACVN